MKLITILEDNRLELVKVEEINFENDHVSVCGIIKDKEGIVRRFAQLITYHAHGTLLEIGTCTVTAEEVEM